MRVFEGMSGKKQMRRKIEDAWERYLSTTTKKCWHLYRRTLTLAMLPSLRLRRKTRALICFAH